MEVQIDTEVLKLALSRAAGVAKKGGPMPILASVLLEASGQGLRVSAFDGEMAMQASYAAMVSEPGGIVLRHKEFYDIARALPSGKASLRTTPAHKARIEAGKAKFNLSGYAPEDFPAVPTPEATASFEIAAETILGLIERTEHAICADETRPEMNGVLLDAVPGRIRMVACDGHRLAVADAPGTGLYLPPAIIPRRALLEVKRIAADAEGLCRLGFTQSAMVFEAGSVAIVARLVAGTFPDYKRIIPEAPANQLVFGREAMIETVRRLTTLASGGIRLDVSAGKVKLSVQDPELGDAEEEVDANYSGEAITIGFNPRYLLDTLGSVATANVALGLSDDTAPAVLKAGDFTALIMPMRVGN